MFLAFPVERLDSRQMSVTAEDSQRRYSFRPNVAMQWRCSLQYCQRVLWLPRSTSPHHPVATDAQYGEFRRECCFVAVLPLKHRLIPLAIARCHRCRNNRIHHTTRMAHCHRIFFCDADTHCKQHIPSCAFANQAGYQLATAWAWPEELLGWRRRRGVWKSAREDEKLGLRVSREVKRRGL